MSALRYSLEFLRVAIVILLAKLCLLVLLPSPLMAGVGQTVEGALWLPDGLSSIYPTYSALTHVLWSELGSRVTGLLLMQVIASAMAAWMLYRLLRRHLHMSPPVCALVIGLVVLDPAQWASERTALPDALARCMVVLAILGVMRQSSDAKWRWALLWLPASGLAALLDPSLDWIIVVLGLLLSLPLSRRSPYLSGWKYASNRWLVGLVWMSGLLGVALLSQNAVHALHRVFGSEQAAVETAGAQRVTAWAPLLTADTAARYELDLSRLQPGLDQGFAHWSGRAQSLYGETGLWAALREEAAKTGVDPQLLARKLAARSLQNDPTALGGVLTASLWPATTDATEQVGSAWPSGRRVYGVIGVLGVMAGLLQLWRQRRAKRSVFPLVLLTSIQCGVLLQLALLNPDISLAKSAWYSFFGLPLMALAVPDGLRRIGGWWIGPVRKSVRALTRTVHDVRQWLASDVALHALQWPVTIVAVSVVVLLMGQDRNWDLLNYHLYNPLAFWQGRPLDVVPAQLQSWYSPFLDLPMFWLATAPISGYWTALWLALPAMLALGLQWRIVVEMTIGLPLASRWVSVVAVLIMTMAASAGSSSLGTTFNEWPMAAAVMFSLLVLLRIARSGEVKPWALFLAAFVPGAVTGLKLTGVPYCMALGAAAWIALPSTWRWRGISLFMLGGVVGGVLTLAPWAIHVWRETGNPFFPYYNQWFQSPDALPMSHVFSAYRPDSLWSALRSPWDLAWGVRWFSELPTADARILMGWLVVVGGLYAHRAASQEQRKLMVTVGAFFVVGYMGWLHMHAIHRYTIPLEMTAALLLLIWLGQWLTTGRIVLIMVTVALQVFTVTPDWGRTAVTTPFARNDHPAYPERSALVIFSNSPLGYVAVDLPADVPLLSLNNNLVRRDECRRWQREGQSRLDAAQQIWMVQAQAQTTEVEYQTMQAYGLETDGGCGEVASSLRPFWLCPVQSTPHTATICSGVADSTPEH
jgi:hypothetical protein